LTLFSTFAEQKEANPESAEFSRLFASVSFFFLLYKELKASIKVSEQRFHFSCKIGKRKGKGED